MKQFVYFLTFVFLCIVFISCTKKSEEKYKPSAQELDLQYSETWNKPEYEQANSAENANYLNNVEKRIFYYLNLARLNPPLFANTYTKSYNGAVGYPNHSEFEKYKNSLIDELLSLSELEVLQPDSILWETALCHSTYLGTNGKTGHDRSDSNCPIDYNAENIAYGHFIALEIVMQLLIDYGVSDLSHRKICLGNYNIAGISMHSHTTLDVCTVLDFK